MRVTKGEKMRQMNFGLVTEYSFWGNVEYASNNEAKVARDKLAKELKAQGYIILKSRLADQMKRYDGIGQYNGTIGHVYKLRVQKAGAV